MKEKKNKKKVRGNKMRILTNREENSIVLFEIFARGLLLNVDYNRSLPSITYTLFLFKYIYTILSETKNVILYGIYFLCRFITFLIR